MPHFLVKFNGVNGVVQFRNEIARDNASVNIIKERAHISRSTCAVAFGVDENFFGTVV